VIEKRETIFEKSGERVKSATHGRGCRAGFEAGVKGLTVIGA
jgi:hypothetical protein